MPPPRPLVQPSPAAERATLAALLAQHRGAIRPLAAALGWSPGAVYRALSRLGLEEEARSYSRSERQPPREGRKPRGKRGEEKSTGG